MGFIAIRHIRFFDILWRLCLIVSNMLNEAVFHFLLVFWHRSCRLKRQICLICTCDSVLDWWVSSFWFRAVLWLPAMNHFHILSTLHIHIYSLRIFCNSQHLKGRTVDPISIVFIFGTKVTKISIVKEEFVVTQGQNSTKKLPLVGKFWVHRFSMGLVKIREGHKGYFWQRANYFWHLAKCCKTTGGIS